MRKSIPHHVCLSDLFILRSGLSPFVTGYQSVLPLFCFTPTTSPSGNISLIVEIPDDEVLRVDLIYYVVPLGGQRLRHWILTGLSSSPGVPIPRRKLVFVDPYFRLPPLSDKHDFSWVDWTGRPVCNRDYGFTGGHWFSRRFETFNQEGRETYFLTGSQTDYPTPSSPYLTCLSLPSLFYPTSTPTP